MTQSRKRWPVSLMARTCAAMLLIVAAIPCVLLGTFLPFALAAQAETDRSYFAQFQQAAAEMERTGRLPARPPAGTPEGPSIYPVSTNDWNCPAALPVRRSDRFTLSFWRGEWTECYAHPSGVTTLRTSLTAQMRGSAGQLFLILWLVGIGAIWGAVRLMRGFRAAATAAGWV
ncbi:hypothetical protein P6144_13910 [Sphingomonas sp. HITSZ_GF]|uniref:hypothetical protein n=1 Tax=Sphingomonas sp. HITSZ_GF TaxID=3037247 RepID=UPI00240DF1D6|nr:hypothetical protein [Sphingomonas sp. HITSZ_GF]MDG2534753.1 hypothetical protein [Sphingomonas sp. HITSZ_GF]